MQVIFAYSLVHFITFALHQFFLRRMYRLNYLLLFNNLLHRPYTVSSPLCHESSTVDVSVQTTSRMMFFSARWIPLLFPIDKIAMYS